MQVAAVLTLNLHYICVESAAKLCGVQIAVIHLHSARSRIYPCMVDTAIFPGVLAKKGGLVSQASLA
jgi:hypothetical protein